MGQITPISWVKEIRQSARVSDGVKVVSRLASITNHSYTKSITPVSTIKEIRQKVRIV